MNSKYKNIDAKFKDIESYLIQKTSSGIVHLNDLRSLLKNFKHQFKNKWESCQRNRSKLISAETNWLNRTIQLKKYQMPVGRPSGSFNTSSEQTKRKRTAELQATVPTEELIYAAQMNLRAEGKNV